MDYDQNLRPIKRDVRRWGGVWGVWVWSGSGFVTNLRRYYYRTRAQARMADIADVPGDGSGRTE